MFQLSIRHALTHYYTEVFLVPAYPMGSGLFRLRCFGPCEIEVPGRLQEFGRKKAEHGMSGRFEGDLMVQLAMAACFPHLWAVFEALR